MNTGKLRRYRFATEAQWAACQFTQTDRDALRKRGVVRPFAPYERLAALTPSLGAHAPVVTRAGEILWRDDNGALQRLTGCDDTPESHPAPFAIARAARIVATPGGLWVMGVPFPEAGPTQAALAQRCLPDSLQRHDEATLTRLLTVDLPDVCVSDIANAGDDSVLALVRRCGSETAEQAEDESVWQAVCVDRTGRIVQTVEFQGIAHAEAFVFLRRAEKFIILTGGRHPRLYWFAAEGGAAIFSLAVAALRPCFQAGALGSDAQELFFLAGADNDGAGPAYVVILDGDGNLLGDVPLDAPATGVTATRDSLLVTSPRGLLRFKVAEAVPEGAAQARCTLVTPALFSPDREDRRRWLRIEATVNLPEGSTLEIAWAATDDTATRERLNAIATNDLIPATQRVAKLLNESEVRRGQALFYGAANTNEQNAQTCSAKLFDVSERYLWVYITLTAATGARLPQLAELTVLYPGRTLMENLPAIYQREEEQPDSFLRALVGVLETTTQGLDARIGALSSHVHPATASEPWLDFIAQWLGVPWDDALSLEQKRAIVQRAPVLAQRRGTRAGLEALLESLLPGAPRRFRVTDATADFGFAVVGGASCAGSALPAMLGGRTRWSAELDAHAVLGYMRLPCPGQLEDGAWQLAGRVRVEVAANATERKAWEPWLLALITEMVPLTARVELRWVTAHALRTHRLDGTMTLESPPPPHLGTDAITSLARLPERPVGLSAAGPLMGTRLR